MTDISIIILSYNTKDLLHACLKSLFNHVDKERCEIIVIDNASTDESASMVRKYFPHVTLILSDKNLGFAKGINLGVKAAKGKYFLFLNSDAAISDDSIEQMILLMKSNENIGVVGGMLRNQDGSLQRSFGTFYNLPSVMKMLMGGDAAETFRNTFPHPKSVDWVNGGFMLVRKDVYDAVHGFDEDFFMYIEDMEFCYRVKKLGYTVYIHPHAIVTHVGQGSSNRSFAVQHIFKGLLLFYKKHKSSWEYNVLKLLLISKATILLALGTITQNTYLKTTYRKALQG